MMRISKEVLEDLYLNWHLPMAEIGELLGCTRQNIYHLIKKFQIDGSTAERFSVGCDWCGTEYSITRKRYVRSVKHFCKPFCYQSYMHNDEYRQSRMGQRHGRVVMEKSLNRSLRQGEVIHHIDGNNLNNEIKNLILFQSASEHLKHHHIMRQER